MSWAGPAGAVPDVRERGSQFSGAAAMAEVEVRVWHARQ